MDIKKAISIIIVIFFVIEFTNAEAQLVLTQEERDYIAEKTVIKAASIDGVAPLHYKDSKGEIKGIAILVLEEIADMTGLVFECELYDSAVETFESDADVLFSLPEQYTPPGMMLSKTYLKSEAILYVNSSQDPNKLEDKIYAALIGGSLPEGVKEENVIYCGTREESLDAVEAGRADYGYGNAYSLAFYMLQNDYKNIVTIPKGKEIREYRMGFPKDDEILLSIINKAIDVIDESRMQTLILNVASRVDRKITFSMIMETYGKWILGVVLLAISILSTSVASNVRSNKRLKTQNKINEMLSQISNEYLYEYFVKSNRLEVSEKYTQLFETREQLNKVKDILKSTLLNNNLDGNIPMIKLPIANDEEHIFKSVGLNIHDEKRKSELVVGKLIDISKEMAERKELIVKAKIDGLTGLYNASTTKELINKNIKNRGKREINALIAIDCDKFKYINDTYGHLTGDKVLENVSIGLKSTFRQNDIIGRVGGDEFCVYMKNIPLVDLVQSKCQQLNKTIQEINRGFHISVSCGIAFLREENTYEELFAKADESLYEAKKKGGGQSVVYNEKQQMSYKGNSV